MEERVVKMDVTMDENEQSEIVVESVAHFNDRNEVELEGTIISRYDAAKVTLLTVLTSTGRTKTDTSGLTVIVDAGKRDMLEQLGNGKRVHIVGSLRNRLKGKPENKQYELVVRADKIELAKSDMEEKFGLKGRVFDSSYNKVILAGTVSRMVQSSKGVARITLRIEEKDKRPVYIDTTLFAKNMKKLLPSIVIGNKIGLIGEVQSSKVLDAEGKPKYYKSVVIKDMKEI